METEDRWDTGDTKRQVTAAGPVKEYMEVFVSAVEHPGHFWVQIITSTSLQLDKLTDDMTAFYNNQATAQVVVCVLGGGRRKEGGLTDDMAAFYSNHATTQVNLEGLGCLIT